MTLLEILNFSSLFQFDQRVSALETKVSEFNQTSQFAKVVSSILGIVDNYLASKLKEKVDVAVRLQSNKLQKEAEAENQEFINKIEDYVTESLRAEVLVRSTDQPQTSYVVAASLLEFELKKILIDKIDIQRNLYNALVESYNTEKDILSTYGDVVTLKRGRHDQDKDEDPSAGSDQGIKKKSTQASEPEFKVADTEMYQDQGNESGHIDDQPNNKTAPKHDWFQKPEKPTTPDRTWNKSKSVNFRPPQKWICTIAKEFPADYFINNDLEYLKGGSSSSKYATSTTRTKVNKIIAVTSVKVMRWYDYRYLEKIVVQRDDNVLYKFKEGDFPRLNLCDIEDMLLLLVQKKLFNIDVDDRYDLGVPLQMFTRRIVIHHLKAIRRSSTSPDQRQLDLTSPN
nr:hypothetical protein [Tanacetum cinerariifolium]